ncbi:unnamed protein product [Cercopithifilaria johnstoni]|uniref:Rhodanese domain-containing protein n=1 Tax=Cercopithifilaria johnstoni TaxID=2874296 RepID=A0A8J2Q7J1_9BILA|nr:unnamed protein product [Cercopithifilaria johnstoni]
MKSKGTETNKIARKVVTRTTTLQVELNSSRLLSPLALMFIAVPLPTVSIDRVVAILIDEKALATKPLVILDVRPEEQFVKGHIIGAEHYPRFLLCREHYETESMKRVGTQGTLTVCGQIYGAGQVVSTFRDRGHNAVLLKGDLDSWRCKYPEGLLTTANDKSIKLELSKLAAQLAINRKPAFERAGFLKATTSSINRNKVREEMRQRSQTNKRRAWR